MGDQDFAPGHLVVDVGEPQPTTPVSRSSTVVPATFWVALRTCDPRRVARSAALGTWAGWHGAGTSRRESCEVRGVVVVIGTAGGSAAFRSFAPEDPIGERSPQCRRSRNEATRSHVMEPLTVTR